MLDKTRHRVIFEKNNDSIKDMSLEELKTRALQIESNLNDHVNLLEIYKQQSFFYLCIVSICVLVMMYEAITQTELGFFFWVGVSIYYTFSYKLSLDSQYRTSAMIVFFNRSLERIHNAIKSAENN